MSTNRINLLTIVPIVAFLSGCFGGSGGGGSTDAYSAFLDEALHLRRDAALLQRNDFADLPTSGSASYDGVAQISLGMRTSDQRRLAGAMDLTVDFAGPGRITGSIWDIVSDGNIYDDTPVRGRWAEC